MSSRAASAAIAAAFVAGVGVGVGALAPLPPHMAERAATLYVPAIVVVAIASMAVVAWRVEPAYTLSAAVALTPFAGNWPRLGVPGPLSPDRLLLAAAIVAVLLRAPPVADRPRLRISGAHWLLALAVVYAFGSALLAGTLFEREAFFKLVDAFGIMPFLAFLVAPLAFRTPRQRGVLLGTLVALGVYLGLTVVFEEAKLDALVFPKYILDPNYGIHAHLGRGPFVDAVANGLALYVCAVASAIAVATWRTPRMRALAVVVGLLCVVGSFLSLERSVWIGVVAGSTVAMLSTRGLRRYFLPLAVAVTLAVIVALALIPGLSETVERRANQGREALWDRENLARAAVNMVEARPLLGFGWSSFTTESTDYFEQSFDFPLTATRAGIHNVPLTYAVELGLIGMTLWLAGVIVGVGGALATRGPPDLANWRVGLLAVGVAYLIVMNSVPPTAWLNRSLWILAGVVYSGRYMRSANTRTPG